MGIIYIAPPKEKNTSDSRLREWSGRTSQPQQGYPEVMAKSWSKKKNIAKYVVVEVWTIHTYIYIKNRKQQIMVCEPSIYSMSKIC